MRLETARRHLRHCLVLSCTALAAFPRPASAQSEPPPSLLQVEVRDSIGLPLPDAAMEVFTLLDGGIVWEWARVEASQLPAGIHLLRFSHPGYRTSVFSVPLRDGSKVSLRVRLDPLRDTTSHVGQIEAYPVRAIGLALEGRAKTDIIGSRRVLVPGSLERTGVTTMGSLMRRARNTDLNVIPARGGSFNVFGRGTAGGYGCTPAVMLNGDRRRVLAFAAVDGLYGASEVEAIEIFTVGPTVPFSYVTPRSGCGVMVMWLKTP